MTVEELQVLITANTNELRKEIGNANKSIAGLQKSANKGTAGVTKAFKMLKTGIVALGIGKVIKDSIQSGMDAIESDSLFETSLGANADAVRSWSDEVSNVLGLSAVAMRKNTGVIYNMTSSMGVAEDSALKMSKGVSLLSEDMASFYNLDSTEAFNKLRAGLTGETEPLKALGILVDENTVKQVAYQEGIAQTGAELTNEQKVLARYVAILKQTGNAQGDLARTINSPANQLRQLKQSVTDLGIAFSNFLMPVVSAVLPYLTAFTKVITQALNGLASFLGLTSKGTSDETKKIADNFGGIGGDIEKADKKAKKMKNTLAGFDEMNVLQDNSSDSSSGSGSSGAVGGGTGFELGEYDAHLDWVSSKSDEISEKIKGAFKTIGDLSVKAWNSEPVQAFVNTAKKYGGFLWSYWSTLGQDLYENITNTWGNIKNNVSGTMTNISTLWTNMWTDIGVGIDTWGQPIIDGVSKLFNSIWADAVDPYLQIITGVWKDFTGILVELWNEYGQPLINNIGEFITNIIGLFQSLWDNVLAPIIQPFLEMMSNLWNEHIKGLVKEVGSFIMTLVNGALEIYNKFIDPIVKWLLEFLAPKIKWAFDFIWGIIGVVIGWIVDKVQAVIQIFRGLIDFVVGVFTGNWSKAWDGIKTMFGGVVNSIKATWTALKDALKVVVDAIVGFFKASWEQIKIIWSTVGSFFSGIWNGIKNVFSSIGTWFSNIFTGAWNGIKNAWSSVKTWFSNIWTGIKDVFSAVGTWFKNIFSSAWTGIKNVFSGVGTFFSGIWTSIKNVFSNVGATIGNAITNTVKKAINGVLSTAVSIINGFISAINLAIGLINKIPGVEIKKLSKLEVPKMARGGIVDSPTIAMVGEAGKEAVMPLERNTGWIDQLAGKIGDKIGGVAGNIKLIVKLGEDTIFDKFIEYGKEKAFETNGEVVFV